MFLNTRSAGVNLCTVLLATASALAVANGATFENCTDVLFSDPRSVDGEYTLVPSGLGCAALNMELKVWCHGLQSGSRPQEFLTINPGRTRSEYLCGPHCQSDDPRSSTIHTEYSKIRIDPCTLKVDVTDRTFATSSGSITRKHYTMNAQPLAVASSCEDLGTQNRPGVATIDLTGTNLAIASDFATRGIGPAYGNIVFLDGRRRQIAIMQGGGWCGDFGPIGYSYPSVERGLWQNDPQWVLTLTPLQRTEQGNSSTDSSLV